jgi:hypothetical protein
MCIFSAERHFKWGIAGQLNCGMVEELVNKKKIF